MRTAENPLLTAPTVLGRVRECIRYLHYSIRTEKSYVCCLRKFLRFHDMRHPAHLGQAEVEAVLRWLADDQRVAPATYREALAGVRGRHPLPVVLALVGRHFAAAGTTPYVDITATRAANGLAKA